MKLFKASDIKLEKTNNNFFTGEVLRGPFLPPGESEDFVMGVVSYPKGVRNKFHTHDGDQILIATAGEGIVATMEEQWRLSAGDIICIPAGLNHWHGASDESEFSHLAIVRAGDKLTQTED